MKKQEGGKSVRARRAPTVPRRKTAAMRRLASRTSTVHRRAARASSTRFSPVAKNVRGTGAARFAENLLLFALSYLVMLVVVWMVLAGYSMAVWENIVPGLSQAYRSEVSSVFLEEVPPASQTDTSTPVLQRLGTTDGLLVIPSTVRDGNIYAPAGVPVTIVATIPEGFSDASLYIAGEGGPSPFDEGVTYSEADDGTVVFLTASSTLQSGQRIGVLAPSEEGRAWFLGKEFIVE